MEVKAEFSVGDEVVDILSKKGGVLVTVKERNRGVQRYVVRFGNVVEISCPLADKISGNC